MIRKKLLLVDDSRLVAEMEKSILGGKDYIYREAATGKRALELLHTFKPDLVLLDIILPDCRGHEICSHIRRDDYLKNTSIIMVTVSAFAEEKERCFKAGCNDFIPKPIDPSELKQKVQKLINIPDRIPYRVLVKISEEDGRESQYLLANSVNVSENGMLFESKAKLEKGDNLRLEFYVPSKRQNIVTRARVVRKQEQGFKNAVGYGVTFTEISDENRKSLARHINKHTEPSIPDREVTFGPAKEDKTEIIS